MLGNIPGTGIYRNLDHYKEARSVTGFLILSIEAPINFANTTYLKERLVLELPLLHCIIVLLYLLIELILPTKGFQDGYKTARKREPRNNRGLDLWSLICLVCPSILPSFHHHFSYEEEKLLTVILSCSCECHWYKWNLIVQGFEYGTGKERSWGKYTEFTFFTCQMHSLTPGFFIPLQLVLVNPIGEVLEKLQRADETKDMMRPDCLFLTVEEAVASLSSSIKYQIPELVWYANI